MCDVARGLDLERNVSHKKSVPGIKSSIRGAQGNDEVGDQVTPADILDADYVEDSADE